jgi:hypothetical protein
VVRQERQGRVLAGESIPTVHRRWKRLIGRSGVSDRTKATAFLPMVLTLGLDQVE